MLRASSLLVLFLAASGVMLTAGCGRATPVLVLKNSSDDGNGLYSISYYLRDIDESNADLMVSFTKDGGATWQPSTAGTGGSGISGLPTSQKGTYHTYVWDYGADIGPGLKQNVRVWLMPVDTDGNDRGKGAMTGPLTFGAPIMYAANFDDDTISIINTENFGGNAAALGTIRVGEGPYRMTYVPSMQKLYVGNRVGGTVSVIDTKTNSLRTTITVGNDPCALGVAWAEDRVYVANREDNTVTGISTQLDVAFVTVPVGNSPSGIAVSKPDPVTYAHQIYVTNFDNDSVTIITVDADGFLYPSQIIPVGGRPEGIAVSPDGVYLWVVCSGWNAVWVYETATLDPLGLGATIIPVGDEPTDIVFTEDGRYVYVNNFASDDVVKIDAVTRILISHISVNAAPTSLTVSSDGESLYVSNFYDAIVTGVNPDTNSIIGTTAVGSSPAGLIILPGAP